MKILCAYSSLEFTVEHFPGTLTSREASHPIFSLTQRKLFSYLPRWSSGELTETDNYLYFLALLRSSDLVEFRVPAIRTSATAAIVALNLEQLCKTLTKLNTVSSPASVFPRYVITSETKDLSNVSYWIHNWEEAFENHQSGYQSAHDNSKLLRREAALERLIRNPHKPVSSYASQIADWAAVAGNFPETPTVSRFTSQKCSLSDYWKQIIVRAASEDSVYGVNRADLEELLEHCETEIPFGSVFASSVFKILRHALAKQKDFLDLSLTGYTFVDRVSGKQSPDEIETGNLQLIISGAPSTEPKQSDYPTKMSYLKAKMAWEMAKKATKLTGN